MACRRVDPYVGPVSYLVVGRRDGDEWDVEVQGIGRASADELGGIETAARRLLASYGYADADTADLQLLLPDFEVDLEAQGIPGEKRPTWALISGLILLLVVVGAIAFVIGRIV